MPPESIDALPRIRHRREGENRDLYRKNGAACRRRTPELGRVAATWAAGQATEQNQWALELWRATEEKRAALVALRQSEETLRQVWQQLRPPWAAPPTAVPPACPPSGRAPASTAMGSGAVKRHGHREQAGEQVMTNLWEGRAPGASRPQA